jgi:hypothetical protein
MMEIKFQKNKLKNCKVNKKKIFLDNKIKFKIMPAIKMFQRNQLKKK